MRGKVLRLTAGDNMKDKILVIDDEEIIRKRLGKLLSLDGYEVLTAKNGQQGLDIFEKMKEEKRDPIKVALVDIKMPGMDGIEVLKGIKKSIPQTEVIIITGHGSIESAIQALRIGAFDYVTKPIQYDELALDISRALEKQDIIRNYERALALFTISSELHKTLNLDEVYQIILDTLKQIIGVKSASILMRNEETGELEIATSIPPHLNPLPQGRGSNKDQKSPLPSKEEDLSAAESPPLPNGEREKAHRAFSGEGKWVTAKYPLKLEDKTIGGIHIHSLLPHKKELTKEDEALLELLAEQAAVAITGAKLYTYSTKGLAALRDKLDKTIKVKVLVPERKLTPEIAKKLNSKYTQIMKNYLKTGDLAKEDETVFDICQDLIEYDISPKKIITLHLKVVSDMASSIKRQENQRIVLAARMVLLKVMTSYASLCREHYILAAGESKVTPARQREQSVGETPSK